MEHNFQQRCECKTSQNPQAHLSFQRLTEDAELKVEKINAGGHISCKKWELEHIHKRVEVFVLNYDTDETDIMKFSSGLTHNVAI